MDPFKVGDKVRLKGRLGLVVEIIKVSHEHLLGVNYIIRFSDGRMMAISHSVLMTQIYIEEEK